VAVADFDDVETRAAELIEDNIVQLDWEEVQELVAGVLRGMGYRTSVSAKGADRGVDIFASPDGLGLEEPRIFVEVKHRTQKSMGAPELRAFLGGRQAGDRCLYVSTGGFTREARYEAERSGIPVTLIDLPRLRQLLVEQYGELDAATTSLVPLKHLYWPSE
jgi:restriction system protein